MARPKKERKPLPPIWRIPDALWEIIKPVIDELDASPVVGRPRIDAREALDAIIYRARSGVQWNHLPDEFPDDSSVHRTMTRWIERGVMDRIWAVLIEQCEDVKSVHWEWQSVDCAMGKARFGGIAGGRILPIAPSPVASAAC